MKRILAQAGITPGEWDIQ